jgi:hypothetical protein
MCLIKGAFVGEKILNPKIYILCRYLTSNFSINVILKNVNFFAFFKIIGGYFIFWM